MKGSRVACATEEFEDLSSKFKFKSGKRGRVQSFPFRKDIYNSHYQQAFEQIENSDYNIIVS